MGCNTLEPLSTLTRVFVLAMAEHHALLFLAMGVQLAIIWLRMVR
jgi:hypothetical protein